MCGSTNRFPILVRFFKRWVPGFEASHLLEIAPMLGVRESRRIMGDHLLTAEDLVAGRVFDDAVCMGGYHIDIHRPAGTWVDSHNVRSLHDSFAESDRPGTWRDY